MAEHPLWQQLLVRSEEIAGIDATSEEGRKQLQAHLCAVYEAYHHNVDPADDFAAFVAVSLCRSVAKALAAPHRHGP